MSEVFVRLERRDRVALVRIDRPKVNALSIALLAQLAQVMAELHADLPGAVVISGGERIFAAGADIVELADPELSQTIAQTFATAFDAVAGLPRAVIAAISGVALGGGCELALACDFRFASDKARFGQPEILLGVIPGAGATQRLARLIGPARAKDLVLTGRQLDAAEAQAIGLIDRVFAPEQLLEEALGFAAQLAAGAVVAQGLAKRAINEGLDLSLENGLALERALFARSLETVDAGIGIRSFLEHGAGHAEFVGK